MKNNSVASCIAPSQRQTEVAMASSSSGIGSKKRSYYAAFKLEVVKYAEEHSKAKAARAFKVDRRRIVEWCQSKEKLLTCPNDRLRMAGGGKKPLMAGVEVELEEWMRERRREGQKVTMKMVMAEAERRAREQGIEFRGSRGWLYNFTKRHDIKFRGAPTETESPAKRFLRSTAAPETPDRAMAGTHVSQPENMARRLESAKQTLKQLQCTLAPVESGTTLAPDERRSGTSLAPDESVLAPGTTPASDESGTTPAPDESGTVLMPVEGGMALAHAGEVTVVSEKTKDRSRSLPPQRQRQSARKRSRSQSSLSHDVRDSLATEKQTDRQKRNVSSAKRNTDSQKRSKTQAATDSLENFSKPQKTSQKKTALQQGSETAAYNKPDNSQKPKEPQNRNRGSSKSKNQRQPADPDIIVEVLAVEPSDITPPPAVAESTSTVDITPTPEPLPPQPEPAQDTAWQESQEQDTFVVVVDKMDDDT